MSGDYDIHFHFLLSTRTASAAAGVLCRLSRTGLIFEIIGEERLAPLSLDTRTLLEVSDESFRPEWAEFSEYVSRSVRECQI